MNTINEVTVTGELAGETCEAWSPSGVKRLVFAVVTFEGPWNCEMDWPPDGASRELRGGMMVEVHGRLLARPWKRHGVQRGWERLIGAVEVRDETGRRWVEGAPRDWMLAAAGDRTLERVGV
jgi:hypothetical protein